MNRAEFQHSEKVSRRCESSHGAGWEREKHSEKKLHNRKMEKKEWHGESFVDAAVGYFVAASLALHFGDI